MLGAVEDLLCWGYHSCHITLQLFEADHFVAGKFLPGLMHFSAQITNKFSTVTTESTSLSLLALLALCLLPFLPLLDFLESILNLKQVVDVECRLEARHTTCW